jgi:hypothetical protein
VTYSYTDASIQCRLLIQSGYCLGGDELCFKSTECPTADYEFLTLYPTNFAVLDEMLAYSRYRTNPEVICINQDVPTYFYAVQRSRLPMVAMPLDRGLSDTSTGEVNQIYPTKLSNVLLVSSMFPSLSTRRYANAYRHWSGNCRQHKSHSSHHSSFRTE